MHPCLSHSDYILLCILFVGRPGALDGSDSDEDSYGIGPPSPVLAISIYLSLILHVAPSDYDLYSTLVF